MEKNKVLSYFFIVINLLILIVILLTSVEFACFNRDFYHSEYKKLDVANVIGINDVELATVTDKLLCYVQNDCADLSVKVQINGQETEFFNQREIDHMVDVKDLWMKAFSLRNILLVVVIVANLIFISNKKVHWLADSLKALAMFGGFILAIGIYAITNFPSFWYNFHLIFFRNDLWLLNPATDRLIMLVPEQFFFDLVLKIITYFGIFTLLYYLVIFLRDKGKKI